MKCHGVDAKKLPFHFQPGHLQEKQDWCTELDVIKLMS